MSREEVEEVGSELGLHPAGGDWGQAPWVCSPSTGAAQWPLPSSEHRLPSRGGSRQACLSRAPVPLPHPG